MNFSKKDNIFMIVYSYHFDNCYFELQFEHNGFFVSHILVFRVNIIICLLMNADNGMDGVEENHVLICGPCITFRSYI